MSGAEDVKREVWTAEDEAAFQPLYRKRMRIKMAEVRDRRRAKKFGTRSTRKDTV